MKNKKLQKNRTGKKFLFILILIVLIILGAFVYIKYIERKFFTRNI